MTEMRFSVVVLIARLAQVETRPLVNGELHGELVLVLTSSAKFCAELGNDFVGWSATIRVTLVLFECFVESFLLPIEKWWHEARLVRSQAGQVPVRLSQFLSRFQCMPFWRSRKLDLLDCEVPQPVHVGS